MRGDTAFVQRSVCVATMAKHVPGSVNVSSARLQVFVHLDAGRSVLNRGIFEAQINTWRAACGNQNFVHADGFFYAATQEGDARAEPVFYDTKGSRLREGRDAFVLQQ